MIRTLAVIAALALCGCSWLPKIETVCTINTQTNELECQAKGTLPLGPKKQGVGMVADVPVAANPVPAPPVAAKVYRPQLGK